MRFVSVVLIALISLPALADIESEPNNTESIANTLTAGTVITGQLADDEDFDYYQLATSNSDSLEIEFASPNSTGTDNSWLLLVQRPSDSIIIFQEVLSPTAETPVNRVVEITENGNYIILVAPAGGSIPTPIENYDLTVTPNNFQAPLSTFNGVWQDDIGAAFYSVHEGSEGILYIELPLDGSAWKAYLGGRIDSVATLSQVVGPGSATLELTFLTAASLEARYTSCQTEAGGSCPVPNGQLIYTASFVYGN
ncbi:MAG: hypothetical protein GKR91_10740 [Pseudomonadales bacterium]|nr:hypothetical protein [Pseudomonadales bacterium]